MTYIKPETASNQLPTSVREILHLGLAAAQQQDWLSLSNYLKLLPQTKSRKKAKRFILVEKDWQIAFDLAILMLIEADFQHKWEITKLLPLFGGKIIPTLTTLLQDETVEVEVRWFVCQILGNFQDEEAILSLVQLLDSTKDPELIAIAGKTLVKIGNGAIEALENLLTKPEYRFLAVQSLSYIRTAETIAPLLKVTSDPDPELRAIAIKALGSFHDSRIPPVLVTALQDKASKVRQEAATALGFRPDLHDRLDLVNCLRPLLSDFNLEVCRQTSISLGRMKQKAATTALFEVLQADTTPVGLKIDLVKALGWSEISSAVDYLEKALANSTAAVTQEIITILGRITTPELKLQATQVLVNWYSQNQQRSPRLKQALATSLGELRCNQASETLKQLAQDSDRKVRLHALSALKKIL
ncbi:MAG: HEAT repeat domain-containing protein [Pleurocapsa sp. MO_226.B13]|nr:HEAT repeat domain-containing protein [Pleurocapsa sp. MO_226.B13]